MRWKQFFTPVKSFNAEAAKQYMDREHSGEYTLLDVRQPAEYESEHIPGSTLIPLPELGDRITELDPGKPVVVY